jgi:hypothetical protein
MLKLGVALLTVLTCLGLVAQEPPPGPAAITIFNGGFAVVRQTVSLELKRGINRINFTGATAHIEPDSVILRDPQGRRTLQILEQNYRNDPLSEDLLLSLNEGKILEFRTPRWVDEQGQTHYEVVQGKVIRSGYGQSGGAIVEVNGHLEFGLPGEPVFPALGQDTILKPTLDWTLQTDRPGPTTAEISYVTAGMDWHADYNVVAAPKGDTVDLIGWITIENKCGSEFDDARIKLMAGDVNKVTPNRPLIVEAEAKAYAARVEAPPVTEKTFDEYHLYTLERSTTLHDNQTKQVEFVVAGGVKSTRLYVYRGAAAGSNPAYNGYEQIRTNASYGTESNTKVWVMQEFKNTKANHLGMPLPKGRVRFYRRDDDGQMEFIGENGIDHTPADETVRVYTGNAFDIVGERRQTQYKVAAGRKSLDESFEIKVRNHKTEAVEVKIVEPLYRGTNWEIAQKTHDYRRLDSQTVEFAVTVPPESQEVVTYTVHYWW